jgi:sec-independent protein translocase protein TatC
MAKAHRAHAPINDEEETGGMMGFMEHLDELRSRLIKSCVAVGIGMAVAYAFVDRIALFVLGPTLAALPAGTEGLQTTRLGEGFAFYLDIALIAGGLLASPVVLYQVWRFIAPGLYAREKRLALPFVALGLAGTLGGAAFSHYLLFPQMVEFFASFDSPLMRFEPTVQDTFAQYKNMLLAMIAVFQLPTIVLFLARLRVITVRFLWTRLKYAVLLIFIAAALLTPSPDPWTQTVLAVPMLAMYAISIVIAWLAAPRKQADPPGPHLRLVVAAAVLDQARRAGRATRY